MEKLKNGRIYKMKKILASLCLLVILGGAFESEASANRFDQIPPVMMKSFSAPVDQINHLM